MTRRVSVALIAFAALGAPAAAADGVAPAAPAGGDVAASFEEKVGAPLPLDAPFRDERDQPTTLRQCINGKPTILVLAYYRCPLLCTQVLNGLLDALRAMPADYTAGDKFNVVTVSFDPKEHAGLAASKQKAYLAEYGRPGADWRFLTGPANSIRALTETVGFKYEYDRVYKEYNHPSGIVVLTPDGRAARYFLGLGYDKEYKVPGGTTTLRLSLVEASDGKMGSVLDRIALVCYRFDNHAKAYTPNVMLAVRIAGVLTVLAIASGIFFAVRSERRRKRNALPDAGGPSGVTT